MKKHIVLTVALLSLLALMLVGCGAQQDTDGKETSASATEETTVSESVESSNESSKESSKESSSETTAKAPNTEDSNGDGYTKRY